MTDDEFLRFIPHCAGCGEIIAPGERTAGVQRRVPLSNGDMRVQREGDYHAHCAPAGCRVGYITTLPQEPA